MRLRRPGSWQSRKCRFRKRFPRRFLSKNAAAPKAVATAQPKVALPALTPEAKAFARIKKAVAKMGVERPTKTKSFLRHIGAMMGQGSKAEQIDAVVAKLEKEGVVRIAGDAVEYPL